MLREDFEDLLEDDGLSKEHLKVLNCDFKNSFIRGWNRSDTVDLICRKIKNFFELDNFIYPKELLIIYSSNEDKFLFSKRLSEILNDEDLFRQINFQSFGEFLDTYAPRVDVGKRIYKQVSLKRNSRVVFLMDPPEKYRKSRNFIPLMARLFPEEGAKLFFCEYEKFIDPSIVLNNFPGAEIIKLEEIEILPKPRKQQPKTIGVEKPRTVKVPKPEFKSTPPKAYEPQRSRVDRFFNVVSALRELQMEGRTFYDFYIEINPREKEFEIEEAFGEIFKNEFQIHLLWLEINRRNVRKEHITNDLFKDVNRLTHYSHEIQKKIEMGERKYLEKFERMFIDLGIREELNRNQPGKWIILREIVRNLSFPENLNNMMRIVDSRILYFSRLIEHDMFVKNSGIVEPKLSHSAGYTPPQERWKLSGSGGEIEDDEDNYKPRGSAVSRGELFTGIVERIRDFQSRGGSLNGYQILIGERENEGTMEKYFRQIFRNEFEIFMNLIRAMKHIINRTSIPEGLMAEILKWPHYGEGSPSKIIGKRIIYTGRIEELFEDLGMGEHFRKWNPEIWAIFLKISEDLTFGKDLESLLDILNSRIENEAKLLKNELFFRYKDQIDPQLISRPGVGGKLSYKNPKDQERLIEIMDSWNVEESVDRPEDVGAEEEEEEEERTEIAEKLEDEEPTPEIKSPAPLEPLKIRVPGKKSIPEASGDERFARIIEKLKEFQSGGWTLNYYQILVGPAEEEKMIRKYFSRIFHNEFEIFTSWIRIIKLNHQKIPIPEKLLEKLKKWPNLDMHTFEKIVDKKHVYLGSLENMFIDLGIRNHYLRVSPDIWAIFLKITSDLTLDRNLDNLISTINSRVFNESKLIRNELFERVEGKVIPEWIFVPKRRTISYISPEDQRILTSLLKSKTPAERRTISSTKTEGRIIMEKIKRYFSGNWTLEDFLSSFSPHFGGPINPKTLSPKTVENYSKIVGDLRERQNGGHYYENYKILIPPKENPVLLRTLHFMIFLNEFPFSIRLIKMAQNNFYGRNTSEKLISSISFQTFWDKKN